jgi:hypothetical protein
VFVGKIPIVAIQFYAGLLTLENAGKLPMVFQTSRSFGGENRNFRHNYGKSAFLMGKVTINGHFQ